MGKRAKKEKKPGYGKLLDAWTAPDDAGDPVGCLATTFTFSSEFFETECLSRFARLETDPDEDGASHLIEREEKLAQIACAAVLADQHHCRGSRSPRWDLLGIRPPRGLLHAKISLLHWSSRVRLIVASANLTGDGYRRNQEVFGVIDYHDGGDGPVDCLGEIVQFLNDVVSHAEGEQSETPAVQRCRAFLDGVLKEAASWDAAAAPRRAGKRVEIKPVLTGPDRPTAMESLAAHWPAGKPHLAEVVSPFFDPPEAENRPVQELWSLLKQKSQTEVHYHLMAEEIDGEVDLLIHAPKSLLEAQPKERGGQTRLHRLSGEPARPLHAKTIWLQNDTWTGYMIGSSNFTSAGLGVGKVRNLEANLLYLVNAQRNHKAYNALLDAFPESEPIATDAVLNWQAPRNEDEDTDSTVALLPKSFAAAVFASGDDGGLLVRLVIVGEPPAGWRLYINETDALFVDESTWQAAGEPEEYEAPWPQKQPPPYGFTVHWDGSPGGAWLPVNIESSATLPPPDELRDLPLEILIDVLTSGRPLHKAMRQWMKKRKCRTTHEGGAMETDPHARVDTSAYILQRTRRISWALRGLRDRLERPVSTRETLSWRLYGPIGVEALASALLREGRTAQERAFLLTELALELSRVKPKSASASLSAAEIKREIRIASTRILDQVPLDSIGNQSNLNEYIRGVVDKVGSNA